MIKLSMSGMIQVEEFWAFVVTHDLINNKNQTVIKFGKNIVNVVYQL